MSQPQITEADKSQLLDLIASGRAEFTIKVGESTVTFDLASLGDESEAETLVMRANGGVFNSGLRKIAVLAVNISKVGPIDWTATMLAERIRQVGRMQPLVIEFLWDAYTKFRDRQEKRFEAVIADSKKSLADQISDTSTAS